MLIGVANTLEFAGKSSDEDLLIRRGQLIWKALRKHCAAGLDGLPQLESTSSPAVPSLKEIWGAPFYTSRTLSPTYHPLTSDEWTVQLKRSKVARVTAHRYTEVVGLSLGDGHFACCDNSDHVPVVKRSASFRNFEEAKRSVEVLTKDEMSKSLSFWSSPGRTEQICSGSAGTPPTPLSFFLCRVKKNGFSQCSRHRYRLSKSLEPIGTDIFFTQGPLYLWTRQQIEVQRQDETTFHVEI